MAYLDPVKVSPGNYKLVFENDLVRVLEMRVKSGKSDVTHSHPSETVYFIRGGKVRIHLPDGGTPEAEFPDGHSMWHEPWTHRLENIGASDIQPSLLRARNERSTIGHHLSVVSCKGPSRMLLTRPNNYQIRYGRKPSRGEGGQGIDFRVLGWLRLGRQNEGLHLRFSALQ